ncbi:hypothetical protein C8R44DRAFT_730428 [Mycena epipterygia]|nr:hypothetical protein C8R44DRAFT_730428 [Mycena epipterygia]
MCAASYPVTAAMGGGPGVRRTAGNAEVALAFKGGVWESEAGPGTDIPAAGGTGPVPAPEAGACTRCTRRCDLCGVDGDGDRGEGSNSGYTRDAALADAHEAAGVEEEKENNGDCGDTRGKRGRCLWREGGQGQEQEGMQKEWRPGHRSVTGLVITSFVGFARDERTGALPAGVVERGGFFDLCAGDDGGGGYIILAWSKYLNDEFTEDKYGLLYGCLSLQVVTQCQQNTHLFQGFENARRWQFVGWLAAKGRTSG